MAMRSGKENGRIVKQQAELSKQVLPAALRKSLGVKRELQTKPILHSSQRCAAAEWAVTIAVAVEAGMEAGIHIAAAAPEDYAWCARLMASTEPWITLRRDFPACREALRRPGTELFVARDRDKEPAGFILLAPYGMAASPYVASIAVAAEARSRGVGSQLLRFAEQHFSGRRHLFLLVSSFNHRAQQLYRRHGYEFIGELKDYVVPGHSELIFHKGLR
jgi:ribosomal protein S18 acetylase RimI-like enzyme